MRIKICIYQPINLHAGIA